MPQLDRMPTDEQAVENLAKEAGVADLMDLYRKVEEVYIASYGAPSSMPLDFLTDSTNMLPPR
ncbi:MAG: hypothetical protein F4045_04370 [Chloroflexi bacterium]|nr:hypothetical protein [Chloroflexota bacterium]MYK34346.1 hypothetical protein [Chloroflexota bacterium]